MSSKNERQAGSTARACTAIRQLECESEYIYIYILYAGIQSYRGIERLKAEVSNNSASWLMCRNSHLLFP